MAEPTPPIAPTPMNTTVSAAKRTITITTVAQLTAYINRTGDTLGAGGSTSGGPTYGDDVVIAVGTYTPTVPWTLPVPAGTQTGNDYVTFRSASLASLPAAGARVATTDAVNMPVLTYVSGNGVFLVADGVDHYRFLGLKFTPPSGVAMTGALFLQSPSEGTSLASHPQYMIVDRCISKSDTVQGGTQGFQVAGANIAIINCLIYDLVKIGAEAHAILAASGAGPYLIQNNDIQCNSCGVFFGDNIVHNAGVVPSNITVTQNYMHRPVSWNPYSILYRAGSAAVSSNGLTVTITGGTVSSSWADGSTYFAVLADTSKNYANYANGVGNLDNQDVAQLISSVNVGSNTITLSTAEPSHRGSSGLTYKITKWAGHSNIDSGKNFFEIKHAQRVLISANVFEGSWSGNQPLAVQLLSARGSGQISQDINFKDNVIRDCCGAIGITTRPTWQARGISSITAEVGTGFCQFNYPLHDSIESVATGDTVNVTGLTDVTEANGQFRLTLVGTTAYTIPVVKKHDYSGSIPSSLNIFEAGSPPQRLAITNNLIENCMSHDMSFSPEAPVRISVNPVMTMTDGNDDAAISTTGSWAMSDFLMEHNTVVTPTVHPLGADFMGGFLRFDQLGADIDYVGNWKHVNFYVRNNIWRMSNGVDGPSTKYFRAFGGGSLFAYGTNAFNLILDSSRSITKNVFFSTYGIANEMSFWTAPDTGNDFVADDAAVGFTLYSNSTVLNYALAPSSPYKGWATDGADPGISATVLAAAIAGVTNGATVTPTPPPPDTSGTREYALVRIG